jgi:hypothetical protein
MKSFKDLREELSVALDEISKDLMRRYYDKAIDSSEKAYKARDRAVKQDTKRKHTATLIKRDKGIGSVKKRDFARKKGQDYVAGTSSTDSIMRGEKGYSMTTKRSDQLHKNYKDR